jgi:glycosyltransferase involved in cell wall biosynthesis
MGRIGINPARGRTSQFTPARVTLAVLTYIPHLQGYFEGRMDALKLCLGSILKHTDVAYDLLVFDNGSCDEVQAYLGSLQTEGSIQFLIRASENVGKLAALRLIAGFGPGEVIAYTDDDAFFLPGWLGAHLAVLDTFPNVGMVSGSPWRTLFDHGIHSNLRLAETDPEVRIAYGQTIPDEWEIDYALSLGRDVQAHLEMIHGLQDIVIERHGLKAFAAASHNQFVVPKEVLARFTHGAWSDRLMGGMSELDEAVDRAGLLRLTTYERTVKNIGGDPSADMRAEARKLGILIGEKAPDRKARPGWVPGILRWKPIRGVLQGVYNRLFWILSDRSGGWVVPVRGQRDDQR